MATLEKLKQKHKDLGEEIERLEKQGDELQPPGVWRPERYRPGFGCSYEDCPLSDAYTISSCGNISKISGFESDDLLLWRMAHNNVFRTEEQAETYIRVMNRAIELRGDWVPDWSDDGQRKWGVKWWNPSNCATTYYNTISQDTDFHFPCNETAQKFIDEHTEEELKIWLGWR